MKIVKHIVKTPAFIVWTIIISLFFSGCRKYLDEKPDKQLAIPSTLKDLEALLDNNYVLGHINKGLGEASADNYYLKYNDWAALDPENQNMYIWGDEIAYNSFPNVWASLYEGVYYANLMLETLKSIPRNTSDPSAWDNIKGAALFYRAWAFHVLVLDFAPAYDALTAASDPGIPLRFTTDFNVKYDRSTVEETYSQIQIDLHNAIALLPIKSKHLLRPDKQAAYGLLSRVYLSMRDYKNAGLYADSCLFLGRNLLDYNTINPAKRYPFPRFNEEEVFHAFQGGNSTISNLIARVDTVLYKSYNDNDLRKLLFFTGFGDGTYKFRGSYDRSISPFTGIANDEIYLIKAECLARNGKTEDAMDRLNDLLVTRWKSGTFLPFNAPTPDEALDLILQERRKELIMRDLRWMDIKRLNKEGRGIGLKRILRDQTYILPPGSPRFALPIPQYVIDLSGIPQNAR